MRSFRYRFIFLRIRFFRKIVNSLNGRTKQFFSLNFRKLLEKLHDNDEKHYSQFYQKPSSMSLNQEINCNNMTLEMSMDLRVEIDQNMTYTPGLSQVNTKKKIPVIYL